MSIMELSHIKYNKKNNNINVNKINKTIIKTFLFLENLNI